MNEYIEREAAINASKIVYIEYIEIDGEGYEDGNADDIPVVFKRDIEAIPAADVIPVVRCKDCKHSAIDDMGLLYCKCVTYYNHVPNDWFCADGERKDSEGE